MDAPNTQVEQKHQNEIYFAKKKAEDCAGILLAKGDSFFNILRANAYLEKMTRMWRAYHGAYSNNGHSIEFTGEQGELVVLPVNHFANIAQHIFTMITANRPIMEARAVNTDYKSLAQTYIANGVLDYYMREKHLEDCLKKATEMAIVLGTGFVKLDWNATAGEAYDADPETGEMVFEGELEFTNLSPFDVVVDGTKETWNNEWILTRSFQNRYNLIAKYPELKDKLLGVKPKNQHTTYRLAIFSNDDTDDVPVYEFYHKRTEAMPDGRYMLFVDSDIVLLDTKMPYRVLPVFRITPREIMGTPYGYTPMYDIFPIQEGINTLYSSIMTNQNAHAVQNLFVPRGADIAVSTLDGAMNIIEGNAKPEPLQLTATPPEVFNFLNMLIQSAETISGVNSVTRGNPEASLKSGTALALVQSMSLQYISGLQQSYVKLIEDTGTAIIQILKDFAMTPKVIALVGKNNRPLLKEFTGEQISAINRVVVDVGNPLSRCLAKDTSVLMYDGTTKMVQDIRIGEAVMGPDSYPRTVGNVNVGQETMYEVTSRDENRGIKYGCNESHILTLRYCSDDHRYGVHKGDIVDITVGDYLKLTERQKRLLQGFTVGIEFEEKKLELPPYILGSWLGDGNSRNPAITTMDIEMVDVWCAFAESVGMEIRVQENRQPNKSKVYFITSGQQNGSSDRNPVMNSLRSMELINNKHIPHVYLTSSRKQRLDLLAGLIDTDGTRIDETFIFTQKNERLTNDVIYLAKSLGFRVTSKKIKTNSSKLVGQIEGDVYKISIGGDTSEIPTKLPRKQAKSKQKARNPLNYGINVECKGMGTYYGFTLIEEPHFLLGDFTVTHNTTAGRVQMAEQMLQMNLIKSPEQYFQVINTGKIETMFEGEMNELLLVKSENEQMLEAKDVLVSPLDRHRLHINEHKAVLSDPDLRRDPELVKIVLDHIESHLNALRETDPALLQLVGEQPLPPIGMDQGPLPGQEMPSNQSLQGSSMQDMMATQGGNVASGETIRSMTGGQGVQTPNMPSPPPPFENIPVTADQMVPQ